MKIPRLLSVLTLLFSATCAQAQPAPTPTPASTSAADADYAAYETLTKDAGPGMPQNIGYEKFLTWFDGHLKARKAAAMAFYVAHPDDPRRWPMVMSSVEYPPFFITGFRPDVETKGSAAIIPDEAAVTAWRKEGEALIPAMMASADAPLSLKENMEWTLFAKDFRATTAAKAKGEPYDYSGFRVRFDAYLAKYSSLDTAPVMRATDYLGALDEQFPGASAEIWKHLLDTPNAALREKAESRVKFFDMTSRPLDISFTAVDGRAVDLNALHGKVVLVDFWATWCGPCVAELPNVKKVYAAYHDKGFEVVGIALENGKLLPKDTAEQKVTKLEAAKKILTDFTAKNEMPWPQYFDGKYWKTDIATQYGIGSIPAMFLLDQEGKVVSTNARGELLEKEVKRLLKL